jgi:hypothetical protein
MSFRFEQSKLWQLTLADHGDAPTKQERDRLRSAFFSLRANTEILVGRIANALPGLTQHDIMDSEVPANNMSVIACLHRTLVAQGKTPRWTREKNVAPCLFGLMDAIVVSTRKA